VIGQCGSTVHGERSKHASPMNSRDDIKEERGRLSRLPPDADRAEKKNCGYAFERLLHKLFLFEQLALRTSYKPDGEQIGGSIYLKARPTAS
jgi:hypothetical protein